MSNELAAPEWRSARRWAGFAVTGVVVLGLARSAQATADAGGASAEWTSLLPPLLAISVAVWFRQVVVALGSAVVLGSFLAFGPNPLVAIPRGLHEFVWENVGIELSWAPFKVVPGTNLYIFGFTFGLVGMVHVLTRSGGTNGLVELVLRVARSARSTRLATALMGVVIFFDDYANCVVVGTTMRPLTDRMRISREKLSFLVDATAAPVSGVAIISTWVAYEAGLFNEISASIGLDLDGYAIFVRALPFRFYCATMLFFVFVSAALSRDFGPMRAAEDRAARTGAVSRPGAVLLASDLVSKLAPPADRPHRWENAAIPIVVTVGAVIAGMLWSGAPAVGAAGHTFSLTSATTWRVAFGEASSSEVLFWSSLIGSATAVALAVGQRILSLRDALAAWLHGIPAMKLAVAILLLAWAIKSVCDTLQASGFLVGVLGASVPFALLPIATFLIAAAIAFATGTSWGTMGILLPVVLPLAWELGGGDPTRLGIFFLVCAAVLDGAIFGDHCSPISDTTVLSSIASGCDHIDHVRTQTPYAVLCMVIAATAGYGAVAFGVPVGASYLLAGGCVVAVLVLVGRRVAAPVTDPLPPEAAHSGARA